MTKSLDDRIEKIKHSLDVGDDDPKAIAPYLRHGVVGLMPLILRLQAENKALREAIKFAEKWLADGISDEDLEDELLNATFIKAVKKWRAALKGDGDG